MIIQGFKTSAVAAGIKPGGALDLALIWSQTPAVAAAVFTQNAFMAAPLVVCKKHLQETGHRVRALLVNSGNANAATGDAGMQAAQQCAELLAREVGCEPKEILVASTGVIGRTLPVDRIRASIPSLVSGLLPTNIELLAQGIMTTDTVPKIASVEVSGAEIAGVAKGAGMIHPDMATMLSFVMTDAAVPHAELDNALRYAVHRSFNSITVDGDTSTNDTVLLLASGASGVRMRSVQKEFEKALRGVCQSLAEQIVADGEGVQHVIHLRIEQAKDRAEALRVARAISHSLLVKTAWAGADPNWGRILAAVGRSGVRVNPNRVTIFIGAQKVCSASTACVFDERAAHEELSKAESRVIVQLGRGRARLDFLTTDLTTDYVRINADYST